MATLVLSVQNKLSVTSRLFEAYLACPTKCYLQFKGEVGAGSDYTTWAAKRAESYCRNGIHELTAAHPLELGSGSLESGRWKNASWHFALDQIVRSQDLETSLKVVQRITSKETKLSFQLAPIRFVPDNKLSNSDKMVAAFEALALAKSLGIKAGVAKIVHGEMRSIFSVRVNLLSHAVHKAVSQTTALLSASSPPDLILNRHCPECEFQDHCRKIATEKDDLSLLSNMSEKERQKLRAKGIFTVTQLSYTFRPRRRAKKQTEKQEKYLHSLKALAIREKKIHVVGSNELKIEGTHVYLDVEGLPDRDFYYLIGMRIGSGQSVIQHSLWANETDDEKRIWNDFLGILAGVENPILIHYGSYETTFFTRMLARHGVLPEYSSMPAVFERAINLVSVIYAKIYYPTYSNSLKDIARYLDFKWSDTEASGLTSIVWRHQWEEACSGDLLRKLTIYNTEDCAALERVTDTVCALCELKTNSATGGGHDFVDVDSLKREKLYHFGRNDFVLPALEQINKAGYWDYQRGRVFLRTDKRVKAAVQKTVKCKHRPIRINQTIELLDHPSCCPKCGCQKVEHHDWFIKTIEDLKFSKSGIKSWVVRYRFLRYICYSCHSIFYAADRPWQRSGIGSNLRSYIIYQLIELRIPQTTVDHSLNQLFGMSIPVGTAAGQKRLASKIYENTYKEILNNIVAGKFMHADETKISIDNHDAYVWVFTNHDAVAYIYAESREGGMVQELLKDFKGVLVSDFYSAYDSIDCPQQKCLIHLIRDLNDDFFKQPFNDELTSMVREFSELIKAIVETIDRFGLKARFLRKHKKQVDRFNRSILGREFKTEVAIKYQKRFEKNASKLFTFLGYDNVPWNNNNAEHAIKPLAKLRHVFGGQGTPKSIHDYLV